MFQLKVGGTIENLHLDLQFLFLVVDFLDYATETVERPENHLHGFSLPEVRQLLVKPLLKIEGERLDAFAKVRGRKACQERLVGAMQKSVEEFRQKEGAICVGAAGTFRTPEEGERWRMLAEQTFPGEEIRYDPLALSIGCHTGPGAFGMAVWRRADLG